ncbi:MAG: carboxylesterase family protein [Asticcacaulis sp.]
MKPWPVGTARRRAAQDDDAARFVHAYWVNFAKTGDPNGGALPAWPAYDASTDQILLLTPEAGATAEADPWKARFDAISSGQTP